MVQPVEPPSRSNSRPRLSERAPASPGGALSFAPPGSLAEAAPAAAAPPAVAPPTPAPAPAPAAPAPTPAQAPVPAPVAAEKKASVVSSPQAILAEGVVVTFTASENAKKLNGTYTRVLKSEVNGRPVFAGPNGLYLMWLSDGNWAITDQDKPKTDGEDDDVFAYVEDQAADPSVVKGNWQVLDDGEDFVEDAKAAVEASGAPLK